MLSLRSSSISSPGALRRDRANLLQQAEHVQLRPLLDDATVDHPEHVDPAQFNRPSCGGYAGHGGGVHAAPRDTIRHEIAVRMLVNLKRLYVRMRSFPQARFISDLLLTVDPSAIAELRDRGLLAYHLEDFAAALRDLETYLRLLPRRASTSEAGDVENAGPAETEPAGEDAQIWEHVKTLRKRIASFN